MTRVLTAIGLIVFAVYLVFFAPRQIFLGGALLMGTLCYYEYADLVAAHGIPKPGVLGFVLGALLVYSPAYTLPVTAVWLMGQFVWLLRSRSLREIAPAAAAALLGRSIASLPGVLLSTSAPRAFTYCSSPLP